MINVTVLINTGLSVEQAARLANVRTVNDKEVCGTCVFIKNPNPDTVPADIRAIGREVELQERVDEIITTSIDKAVGEALTARFQETARILIGNMKRRSVGLYRFD